MLELRDVRAAYGDFVALHGVSLEVEQGEIVVIVGANGAGKSTTLKTIAGLLAATGGTIALDGRRIDRSRPRALVEAGIAMTLEGRQLFPELTVEENLLVGAEVKRSRRRARANLAAFYERLPVIAERRTRLAGTLSGGEQQMVAIARSLMSEPRLLLLDEPSLGLAPRIVRQISAWVREINALGTTVVLVEQNVAAALEIAHRAYVVAEGRVAFSGSAAEIAADTRVIDAYLGGAVAV